MLCDLLWSDPDKDAIGWQPSLRGVSVTFSQEIIEKFSKKHGIDLICRAHQVNITFYILFYMKKFNKNIFFRL